jgi:hypothetical protein
MQDSRLNHGAIDFLRALFVLAVLCWSAVPLAAPQPDRFVYQGSLEQGGQPANGLFDMEFALFATPSSAAALGATILRPDVPVENGVFQVELDFPGQFAGEQRFLQITIDNASLSPRQAIGSAPYAIHAASAGQAASLASTGNVFDTGVFAPSLVGTAPTRFSAVLGVDEQLFIAIYAPATQDLVLARCRDLFCADFSLLTVDSSGDVGDFNAIALGAGERPILSYYDRTNGDLKFARCSDRNCSSVATRTLDVLGDVGQHTSIAEGGSNGSSLPVIAYYDVGNGDLRFLRCDNLDCTSSSGTVLDSAGDVGHSTRIVVDARRPVVAYRHVSNDQLKLALCANADCSSFATRTLDTTAGSGTGIALTLTHGDRPMLAHVRPSGTSAAVTHVLCNDRTCLSPTVTPLEVVSTVPGIPWFVGRDARPVIWSGKFRLISCEDITCAQFSQNYGAPDFSSIFTASNSATVTTADGVPLLITQASPGLQFLRCANPRCLGHGR